MELVYAIVFGTLFGFVLQRVAAADPNKIITMLTLEDSHLLKAILSGIAIATTLLFTGLYLGVVDVGHLSIKASYWGVIIGGMLLGFGWAFSGFCPGTGLVAGGSGRKDAWFFVLGGLIGAWLYTLSFESLQGSWLLEEIIGGKTMLVDVGTGSSLLEGSASVLLALLIAAVFYSIAYFFPKNLR